MALFLLQNTNSKVYICAKQQIPKYNLRHCALFKTADSPTLAWHSPINISKIAIVLPKSIFVEKFGTFSHVFHVSSADISCFPFTDIFYNSLVIFFLPCAVWTHLSSTSLMTL